MDWLKQLFLRRRLYSDLSEEIQQHLQEKVEELVAGGMNREDATSAAHREFGNLLLQEERGRDVWSWSWLEAIVRDSRFATRQLLRNPGFTFTVILTLTLAIGANTAVFSMVNALLLRPLPFAQPERLAGLTRHLSGVTPSGRRVDDFEDGQDGEAWELVRDRVPSVLPAAYFFGSDGVNLESRGQIRYVLNHRISAAFFDVLGLKPLLGRSFTQADDRVNGPNSVILSYQLWQSLFVGDSGILGQTVHLKGEPYTVIGIMPPQTVTTAAADLWTPLRPWRGGEGGGNNYHMVMRLRPGATWAEVNTQLRPLHPAMFDQFFPGSRSELLAQPWQQTLAKEKRGATLMLMSAVGVILLIAVANLAGLILVRTSRRYDELVTRVALGAPRSAIVRQAFLEPLLLTIAGAGCGVALVWLTLNAFAGLFPADMLPLGGIRIDGRVLAFTVLCTAITSLFVGIFPIAATKHIQLRPSLSSRGATGDGGSARTRQILIACEVCFTLVLLASAGLLIKTLMVLRSLPSGFDSNNILTAKASLDDSRYHDPVAFQTLVRDSLSAMRRIPGVESVAMGLSLPYERGLNDGFKVLDGPGAGQSMASSTAYVSPEYFHMLRIPILSGRAFTESDTSTSEPVAIVNLSFARKFLGTQNVIGLHLELGKTKAVIVGLVGDVKKVPGINSSAPLSTEPMYYIPYTQVDRGYLQMIHVWFQPSWLVRSSHSVSGLPEAMQEALAQADPRLPFSGFYKMDDLQAEALSEQRVEVLLFSILAGLALLLSLVGTYGLVSSMVVQRRREIGIRMALGCGLPQAMRAVAGSGIKSTVLGLAAGLIICGFATRLLKSQLFGVHSLDPFTMAVVVLLLLAAALAASFAPTLRIARIDPASTLRTE